MTQRVKKGRCDSCAFRAGDPPKWYFFHWVIYFGFSRIDPLNQKGTVSPLDPHVTQRGRKAITQRVTGLFFARFDNLNPVG